MLDLAAELAERPEAGDQQDRERPQVADHQPADGAGQQRADLQPPAAVEEVGEPAAHRPPRRRRLRVSGFHGIPSSLQRASLSPLDLGPALDPLVVCRADVTAVVSAVGDRSRPVVEVVEVLLARRRRTPRSASCRRSGRTPSRCAGASPNHSATSAFACGSMMWSIHMYVQFGCSASELIIQVSDQPVEPSSGIVGRRPARSSACSVRYWYLPGRADRRCRRWRTPGSPSCSPTSTRRCSDAAA